MFVCGVRRTWLLIAREESNWSIFTTDRVSEDLLRHQIDTDDMLLFGAVMILGRVPGIGLKTHLHNHVHQTSFSLFLAR
jgi:hypothetical protein